MLKPKYVHGVNAEEAPKSLLHRLQNSSGEKVWPFDDIVAPPSGPDGDATQYWTWQLG